MKFWGKIKIKYRSGNGKLLIDLNGPIESLRFFNFSICTWKTRFCQVPSWHRLLFGISIYWCVLFIRNWKIESRCHSIVSRCLLIFREIGTHAFSHGTSWDGSRGHSYCDFGSLLLKTIFERLSSPSFSFKGRY